MQLLFQYISCYCLSLFSVNKRNIVPIFQYISCYCLSYQLGSRMRMTPVFQYISCYCLSFCKLHKLWLIHYFNTSHVTVYRPTFCATSVVCSISIHLMLLFIVDTGTNLVKKFKFQYISCYCLSPFSFVPPTTFVLISIHLMLLFIYHSCPNQPLPCIISIHLMLLFIPFRILY